MPPHELIHRVRRRLLRRTGSGRRAVVHPEVPASLLELLRSGPASLVGAKGIAHEPLKVAIVIPSFRRGSGGHGTLVNLARGLTARGHSVSLWLDDFELLHAPESPATTERNFIEFFDAEGLEFRTGFSVWRGADVVLATGWQTVPRVLMLPGVGARAYLVQDHEPEFYAASAQALLAAWTYRQGLHCIAASSWLAELLTSRYGASASHFDLAVNHSIYRPAQGPRSQRLVVFYARSATARRAVPLGLLAFEELSRRRPDVEIALFGSDRSADTPFRQTDLGVLAPADLAHLYRQATVGVVFSLTNPSLISLEMMACGLPCVELASGSVQATFGSEGPLSLAPPDPLAISDTIERLLDSLEKRERAAAAGQAFMESRTWSRAAEQVERGLRIALAPDRE